MKKIYLFFAIISTLVSYSQITIDNTSYNPYALATQQLIGAGVTVSNVTFNGIPQVSPVHAINPLRDQASLFQNGISANIGFNTGVILTTGQTTVAQISATNPQVGGRSIVSTTPQVGDVDLQQLVTPAVRI